jgi:hypothetical protein
MFTAPLHSRGRSADHIENIQFFYFCVRIRCRRNVFTELLLRNGRCLYAYLAAVAMQRLYTLQYILSSVTDYKWDLD